MAQLTLQKANFTTPAALTYASAAAGGDKFQNSGGCYLHVKAGATAVVVTITAGGAGNPNACSFGVSGGTNHQVQYTVPISNDRLLGPFSKDRFNDVNGDVNVTYDQVSSITVAVVQY